MLVMLALLLSSLVIPSHIAAKENTITIYKNIPVFHSIGHHNWDLLTNGELNVINHFIHENDVVFDIGANVGNWSEQALRVAPHSKFYAFEPIPSIFQQLKTNLAPRGVSVHNCALSDYTGVKTLFFYPQNSELSSLHYRPILKDMLQTEPTQIEVPTINLATFCRDNNIDHIDFLKIDTAGAEVEILRSAQSLLAEQKISFIQFEYGGCYKDSKTTLKEAYSLLTSCGYHIFRIIPNGLVEIIEWDEQLENYIYSNYFASVKELKGGKDFVIPGIKNNWPSSPSFPYISGDTFKSACDFVIDDHQVPFDPAMVKDGDIIFLNSEYVKSDYLEFFFSILHPLITARYILVTHNSDRGVPGKYAPYLDDTKLAAWFGQNILLSDHPKLFPIPIGIANRCWPHGNVKLTTDMKSLAGTLEKTNLLYMNFTLLTNKMRSEIHELFKDAPYCTVSEHVASRQFHYLAWTKYWQSDTQDTYRENDEKENMLYAGYLQDLICSKFVFSPEGNGIDCHRTWEILLMGSIPIVKHSTIDKVFDGLPVLLVDDWQEVTQEFLEKQYAIMNQKNYNMERLYADYWIEQIQDMKRKVVAGLV